MNYKSWLDRWNLKSDPCKDIELNNPENFRYLVPTRSIIGIEAEIQDIRNSNVGVVKPLVGSRGSGKTTCLHYLIWSLRDDEKVLPVYVNVHESLPLIQESKFPLTHTARFVCRELILGIAKCCAKKKLNYVQKESAITNILERAKIRPHSPSEIPDVKDDDLELLASLLHKDGLRVVFGIDELDKFETVQQVRNLADYFRTEQTLHTMLSGKFKTFFYISSSTRWDFLRRQDFSYLSNVFQLQRVEFDEAKMILKKRFEVSNPGSKPPYTNAALASLVSIFNGNPRLFIHAAGNLLRLAHEKNQDVVGELLVRQVYSEEGTHRFREDYDEIVTTNEGAGRGALMIWYLCTKLAPNQRIHALDVLVNAYEGSEVNKKSKLSSFLKELSCFQIDPKEGNSLGLNLYLKSFFKAWEAMGHSPAEFNEWYSNQISEPPGIPYSYRVIQDLHELLKSPDAKQHLIDSWNRYFQLEVSKDPILILDLAWRTLKEEIIAFCIECRTYESKIPITSLEDFGAQKAFSILGVRDPEAKQLFLRFVTALNMARIELQNLGLIVTVYQKCERGSGIKEADMIKDQARTAYNELLIEWTRNLQRRPWNV